jgi:hypothetical protein
MRAQDRSVLTRDVRPGIVRARRWLAICVAVAVASCTAGCGGSNTAGQGKTDAEKWADDVCSSISTWHETVSRAKSTLRHPADLTVSTFEDTVRDVVDATGRLVTEVSDLGPPDTSAGDQAAEQLSKLSDQLDQEKAALKKATAGDASSPSEMLANLSTITGSLAAMSTDITKTLDSLRSLDGAAELRDAFKSSETCRQLRASGSPT